MIDTTFDLRTDAGGRDPDSYSPTLRRYHQLLWSKPLPGGQRFDLDATTPNAYLHHRSALGEFFLASDAVMTTFTGWIAAEPVVSEVPESEIAAFLASVYTIGGMMIFPGNKIGGKITINGARGFNRRIADRFDLTLECIRRHYSGGPSPLDPVLARYGDFFALFGDFRGYVEFFLLDDLVTDDSTVRFFAPFDDFRTSPVPHSVAEYRDYARLSITFIGARNRRIQDWASRQGLPAGPCLGRHAGPAGSPRPPPTPISGRGP